MRYLQLVHNTWDPVARVTKAKVLHSFGREDEVDRAAIERLIASLRRLLDASAGMPAPSGCCSPWSPRGRSSRLPRWQPRRGCPGGRSSPG